MAKTATPAAFAGLEIAVATISDTRTLATDSSGAALIERLEAAGHRLADRQIIADNRYAIRAVLSAWIAAGDVHAIITTGGTGLTGRDITPEAVAPLFDRAIDGFGEMFRAISVQDIGTASLQSRAIAGIANSTAIFCVPGSTNACRTAWDKIIRHQLDSRTEPCNLARLLPRFAEE